MSYKYTGNAPVVPGRYVELHGYPDEWTRAKVVDALAAQFTVKVHKRTEFFMYADEGLSWRRTKD